MRLIIVADGRSPIALSWIRHRVERGDEVFLASTFACAPPHGLRGFFDVPVAFSSARNARAAGPFGAARHVSLRTATRQWLGPLTIPGAARRLRDVIRRVQPDLVHALRIPYEGMLAATACQGVPLAVSVWGNDFTLHAPSTPLMRYYTRRTLRSADALHADCERDVRLAANWGLAPHKATAVIPGNGGIRSQVFHPPARPVEAPVVVNPRGFRGYVRNDTFFRAIPLVLARRADARFVCTAMAAEIQATTWIRELGIGHAVELLPALRPAEMAAVYRRAQVLVSPSVHDGTPNTLLEGLACGCLPVAGDLESIREWIDDGVNGLLVDPGSSEDLAAAIVRGLGDRDLRAAAATHNSQLVAARAEASTCAGRIDAFYAAARARTKRPAYTPARAPWRRESTARVEPVPATSLRRLRER